MKRRVRWVLAVIASVVACGGAFGGGVWLYTGVVDSARAMRTLESYLSSIEDADYNTAYDHLCEGFRRQRTREQYLELQSTQPDWAGHDITGIKHGKLEGRQAWYYDVRLTTAGGQDLDQVIILVDEDGDWKVCKAGLRQPGLTTRIDSPD